ncbi:MAG TPA: hypothetical protein VHZ98_15990 [Galbitalea sp.]|jgi:hypothetical protein|nr:hypothetical protein [Galbitalea sp.]
MARLPVPGQDKGTWGDILNEYLSQSHDADGSIKPGAIGSSQLQDGTVEASKIPDGEIPLQKLSSVGVARGLAEIDSDGDVINADGEKLISATSSNATFVTYLKHDGTPLEGTKVVVITLTEDEADIDNVAVYDSIGDVG